MGDPSTTPTVIPARAGIQRLSVAKTVGPRPPIKALGGMLRGDDDRENARVNPFRRPE
jgi:hypothetical protein